MKKEDLIKLDIEECAGQYCAYLDDMRISKAKPAGVMHNIHSINCRKDYIKEVLGIPKGAVVLSKEEQEYLQAITEKRIKELKKQLAELEEQRDRQAYIAEELIQEKHRWAEQARKETAKEILNRLYEQINETDPQWFGAQIKIIAEKYGVKVE